MDYSIGVTDNNTENRKMLSSMLPKDILKSSHSQFILALNRAGMICGVLSYTLDKNLAEVTFVSVVPSCRMQGLCRRILVFFINAVENSSYKYPIEIIWSKEHEDSIGRIVRSLYGFHIQKKPALFIVSPGMRADSERYGKLLKSGQKSSGILPFSMLSSLTQKAFYAEVKKTDHDMFVDPDEEYLDDLSLCLVHDDRIRSAIFFRESNKNAIELSFLWVEGEYKNAMLALLCEATRLFEKNYSQYQLEFTAINEASCRIAKRLFPEAEPECIYSAIRFL